MERVLKPIGYEEADDHSHIKAYRPDVGQEFIFIFVHVIGFIVNILMHLDNEFHARQKNASKRSNQND